MTITLDIKPEVQAALERQAAAHGQPLENYAADLLEEALRLPSAETAELAAKDMVELFAPLRGLNIDFERDRDADVPRDQGLQQSRSFPSQSLAFTLAIARRTEFNPTPQQHAGGIRTSWEMSSR
jgi:plasmid stability protein